MKNIENENNQQQTQDFIIVSNTNNANIKSLDQKDELDPITKLVRENVLNKQMTMLSDWFKQNSPGEELNKDNIQKISENIELKKRLENAEIKGYRSVFTNDDIKARMQNLNWEGQDNDLKSKIVKDARGEEICTLTETAKKVSFKAVNSNGENVKIDNYRSIDFPTRLKTESTMHLALAVKDRNGNNIAEDKAVYFTAHYEQGKLIEVSSPQPVKFMGKGDDAIGYIEHGGEIYTLPVMQGKYKEMIKEVAANKGVAIDMSQAFEIKEEQSVAKDNIVVPGPEIKKEPTLAQELAPETTKQEVAAQELPTLKKKNIFDKVKELYEGLKDNLKNNKQEVNQNSVENRRAMDVPEFKHDSSSTPNPNNMGTLRRRLDGLGIKSKAFGDLDNQYNKMSDTEKTKAIPKQQESDLNFDKTSKEKIETHRLTRQTSEGIVYSNMSLETTKQNDKKSIKEVEIKARPESKKKTQNVEGTIFEVLPALPTNTEKEVVNKTDKNIVNTRNRSNSEASSLNSNNKQSSKNNEIIKDATEVGDNLKAASKNKETRPRAKSMSSIPKTKNNGMEL